MPMRWTPENDQLLLLKILETSNVQADVRAISSAWPADKGEIPTPRAVSERLVKIRAICKANNGGHFSVTSASTRRPAATTPRKPRTKAPKVAVSDFGPLTPPESDGMQAPLPSAVAGKKRSRPAVAVAPASEASIAPEALLTDDHDNHDAFGEIVEEATSPSKRPRISGFDSQAVGESRYTSSAIDESQTLSAMPTLLDSEDEWA